MKMTLILLINWHCTNQAPTTLRHLDSANTEEHAQPAHRERDQPSHVERDRPAHEKHDPPVHKAPEHATQQEHVHHALAADKPPPLGPRKTSREQERAQEVP